MKFPYGICDFKKIMTEGYFYRDRTSCIPLLEDFGNSLLFLRPRRFGKSLLLSMLSNYYDIAMKDRFGEIFGKTEIGKNPTELRNGYFILKWDFSCVKSSGTGREIERALYNHINRSIKTFKLYYGDYGIPEIEINEDDALDSLLSLAASVRMTHRPVYLLIDEYDNFANEVMMAGRSTQPGDLYKTLVYGDGILKTLFKTIKASAADSLFDRTFITGVSPVVMSDITSGYNIAKNIYLEPIFNELCGFTEEEVEATIAEIVRECGFGEKRKTESLEVMRTYYDGYIFSQDSTERLYNPTLALYFLETFYRNCKYPMEMLDSNLAADDAKLHYISSLSGGDQLLIKLTEKTDNIEIEKLETRFGMSRLLSDKTKDRAFMASFLYYSGVVTMAGRTPRGKLMLKVPNLVMHGLYVDRMREMLLPQPQERDEGVLAAERLFEVGDIKPLCEFVENRFFKVFHNRDYRWANELTVKTIFLTLLYNDTLYIMDSEHEIGRGHSDLTMIIRPDARQFEISDVLLEFKFVSLKEAGLTGRQAAELSDDALKNLPLLRDNMNEAQDQLLKYGDELERKYKNLRLTRHAVVALGFERLWAEKEKSSVPSRAAI